MLTNRNTTPPISCFALSITEWSRRTEAAKVVEAQVHAHDDKQQDHGRTILWHPAFAAAFVASIAAMPLPQIGPYLEGCLARDANQGVALDLTDYAYLADCLREELA